MDNDYCIKIKKDFLIKKDNLLRFGSIDDGGYYLTSSKIIEANILFSGGISSNIEFEYDLFRFNSDLKILMVDPTVSQVKLLIKGFLRFLLFKKNKVRYLFNNLIFIYLLRSKRCWHINKWLSQENGIIDILRSKIENYDQKIIILKLDIEGSEYQLIEEILNNLKLFNCMIFEFHHMDIHNDLVYSFIEECSNDFDLIYLGINPSGGKDSLNRPKNIEITLERK